MPHTLLVLISLAGWLCVVKLATLPFDEGGALGWFTITFGLFFLLSGHRLEDVQDGGLAYAVVAAGGYAWYRLWGKRQLEREEAAENAALARKHDPFCEAGICVPHCPQNPNQKRRDARNEEERKALRTAQSLRDREEVAAEWDTGHGPSTNRTADLPSPRASEATAKSCMALPMFITLNPDALAKVASQFSDEDLDFTLEHVRLLYHEQKGFVSELIHRVPPKETKLARAEQDLTEYGTVFQALSYEQRRRCR